ncbi:MAG: hypothetical protein KAT68_05525 [Bacteroidales bacterium]|nr:hypothetical protein [Bacteroidales bacterium]
MRTLKNIIKLSFLTIIIEIGFLNNCVKAQNTGPAAPEFTSFEPVDATDMVNLITGDFSYTLPIINIPGPEGGYPLALSYHAGITMNQEASWVGLGWNISPGAINRIKNVTPDDTKGNAIYSVAYDPGESDTYYRISGGVGVSKILSITAYTSWHTNKSFGGEIGYGGGVSVGLKDGLRIGGEVGTEGVSMRVGPLNVRTNQNGYSVGFGFGRGQFNGSIGFDGNNISFNGGIINSTGISFNLKDNSSVVYGMLGKPSSYNIGSYSVISSNSSFTIPIWYFAHIGLSTTKIMVWLYSEDNEITYGSLYLGDDGVTSVRPEEWDLQSPIVSMDTYTNPYNDEYYENIEDIEQTNSLSFPAYDKYIVSAQGLSGTISPHLFDFGALARKGIIVDEEEELTFYTLTSNSYPIKKKYNEVYFYFENDFSSYTSIDPVTFDWDADNPPDWSHTIDNGGDPSLDITNTDGLSFYKDNRTGSSKHIEYFTNNDINENYNNCVNKGFIEYNSIKNKRGNNDDDGNAIFETDGIGAYSITVADGKTYHYSIPVYQYEEFSVREEIGAESRENRKFVERRNFEKYAYAWLLTAITGPDFVDRGTIGIIDDDDYGYWVKFEYGKWTDAYIWKFPYEGYDNVKNGWGSYTWGRKQIYYLDKISTRTHTALFIKKERYDGLGAKKDLIDKSHSYPIKKHHDPTVWENICSVIKKVGKGMLYFIFKAGQNDFYSTDESGIHDDNLEHIVEIWSSENGVNRVEFIDIWDDHDIHISEKHKILALDRIILIENNRLIDLAPDSYNNPGHNSEIGKITLANRNRIGVTNEDEDKWHSYSYIKTNYHFGINYYNNILDKKDITASNFNENNDVLKSIQFYYNYSLCNATPNAESCPSNPTQNKLTLTSVNIKGKGGANIIPPYSFNYTEKAEAGFNLDRMDEWGYDKNNPDNWSLKQITTPTGAKINIEYESDEFYNEAALNEIYISFEDYEVRYETNKRVFIVKFPLKYSFNELFAKARNFTFVVYEYFGTSSRTKTYAFPEVYHYVHNIETREIRFHIPPNQYILSTYIKCIKLKGNIITKGGGLKVNNIRLSDEKGNEYVTEYNYNIPNVDKTSGITSYSPTNTQKFIPYINEIPGPEVMYEYVTIKAYDLDGNNERETQYQFQVLPSAENVNEENFRMGNLFWVEEKQTEGNSIGNNGSHFLGEYSRYDFIERMHARSSVIHNNLSSLGRLLNVINKNISGEIINKTIYDYYNFDEHKAGIKKESFADIKCYRIDWVKQWLFTSAGRKTYPNVLKSITTYQGNLWNKTTFGNNNFLNNGFDFQSGKCLITETENSSGKKYRSEIIPAYTISAYQGDEGIVGDDSDDIIGMDSKIYFIKNKNMLTQTAASYTYLLNTDESVAGILSAGIQTWNKDWNYRYYDKTTYKYDDELTTDVWRKHKTFTWKGDINADGTYLWTDNNADGIYEQDYIWDYTDAQNINRGWQKTSEVTRYNHYSAPLEAMDINGNFASGKYDPNENYVIANVSNANYRSFAYSGFETEKTLSGNIVDFGGEIVNETNAERIENEGNILPHTGKYLIKVSGEWGPKYKGETESSGNKGMQKGRKYRASVWVHKNSPNGAALAIHMQGTPDYYDFIEKNSEEGIVFGNWILLNLDFDIPSNYVSSDDDVIVYLKNNDAGTPAYFDDFRVHPIDAPMASYVYDEQTGSVTAILNNENIASYFDYDEAGRLIRTWKETPDGKKKITEHKMSYASSAFYFTPDYYVFGPYGGEKEIKLSNIDNDSWLTQNCPPWITYEIVNTEVGVQTIRFTCAISTLSEKREAVIIFKHQENDIKTTCTIIQESGLVLYTPENVTASLIKYDKITISWDEVPGATHYKVYRNTTNDVYDPGTEVVLNWTDVPSLKYDDIYGLSGITYYYWIKAATNNTGANQSAYSSSAEGYVIPLEPPEITKVSEGIYTDKIYIEWNGIADAPYFMIYKGIDENFENSNPILTDWINGEVYLDTTGEKNVTYYYWVTAGLNIYHGGLKESVQSNMGEGYYLLSLPENVTATQDLPDKIVISWEDFQGGYVYYRVFRSSDDVFANATALGTQWNKGSYYNDTDVGINTETDYYYWVISAKDLNGDDACVHGNSVTGKKAEILYPNVSDNSTGYEVTATDDSYDRIIVTWENPNDNSLQYNYSKSYTFYYKVYRNTAIDGVGREAISDWLTGTTTYTDPASNLNKDIKYYYWIEVAVDDQGICTSGLPDNSDVFGEIKIVPAPENLSASQTGSVNSIEWYDYANEDYSYMVYKSTNNIFTNSFELLENWTSDNSCIDKDTSLFEYYYWVKCKVTDVYGEHISEKSGPIIVLRAPVIEDCDSYHDKIKVNWSICVGLDYYQVYRKNGDNWEVISSWIEELYYDDNDVVPGTYSYRIKGSNGASGEFQSDFSVIKEGRLLNLGTPSITNVTDDDPDKIIISWGSVTNATHYQLYRNTSNSSRGAVVKSWTSGTSYNDTHVTSGTTYWYTTVAAVNSNGKNPSADSDPVSGKRLDIVSPLITVSNCGYLNKINLSWNSFTGATHYQVIRNTENNEVGSKVVQDWSTGNTFADNLANPNTTYYYWVIAASGSSGQNNSGMGTSVYGVARLCVPAGVSATNNLYNKVEISWNSVNDANYYWVYRNTTNSSSGSTNIASAIAINSFTDVTAPPNQTFYYFVKAAQSTSGSYSTDYSSSDSGKLLKLSTPQNISASNWTYNDKIKITWNTVSNASYYKLYRAESETGTRTEVNTNWQVSTSFTDYTAIQNKNYYYFVKAARSSSGAGVSDFSDYDIGKRSNVVCNLSPSSLTFSQNGETKNISITTDVAWSLAENETWISIDQTSGSSGASIIPITCSKNNGTKNRTAVITFSMTGHVTTFSITQDGTATAFP